MPQKTLERRFKFAGQPFALRTRDVIRVMRLGFTAGRRAAAEPRRSGRGQRQSSGDVPLADRLRPLAGQWIAIKDDDASWQRPASRRCEVSFREVPDVGSAGVRPRPIVDVVVEGLDIAPQACLLDSGATAVRFGLHVAELCGIDLDRAPTTELAVAGGIVTARMAEVQLSVDDGTDSYVWSAPAWFCEPWAPAFGLLGLTGFFDHFVVTIASCDERIELLPVNA